jgi:hypothetical protein
VHQAELWEPDEVSYVPATHTSHTDDAMPDWYVPFSQLVHADATVMPAIEE